MFKQILLGAALVFLTGCKSFTNTTKDKTLAAGTDVYGIKISSGPDSSGVMPGVIVGGATIFYVSVPKEEKDACVVMRSRQSAWFSNKITSSRTVVVLTGSNVQSVRVESMLAEDAP